MNWIPILVVGVAAAGAMAAGARELARAVDARRPRPAPVKVPAK